MPELTIFATPKRFEGQFDRIQRNAVDSWVALGPDVEVILIGDDDGTADVCQEHDILHVPSVATNAKGVPLLSDLWRIGQTHATAPVVCFVNADIVLMDDFLEATRAAAKAHNEFLLVGQRWDLDLPQRLNALGGQWPAELRSQVARRGTLNSPLWVDYFAFPVGQYPDLLPCVIGRPGYDHWIVWQTLQRGIPVIDATEAVLAVHQHHDYSHGGGKAAVYKGSDAAYNYDLIGGRAHLRHIGHATQRMNAERRIVKASGAKYIASAIHARLSGVIGATATIRHRLGLNAELLQRLSRPRPPHGPSVADSTDSPTPRRATTTPQSSR